MLGTTISSPAEAADDSGAIMKSSPDLFETCHANTSATTAITGMTVSDAFGILNGGVTAATDYFRGRTYADLRERFHPIIERKIETVGLSRVYGRIADAYNSLPLAGTERLVDLDEYVTDRALSGLFAVLATEEQKIRQDPLARTTDLLRRVFGR